LNSKRQVEHDYHELSAALRLKVNVKIKIKQNV